MLLSHAAVLFPLPAWKQSLVSRVVLQSHLFLTIKPAHYVALPIPAVTIQSAILHLLMTHHDPNSINIMADLVLIILVLSDGRAIGTALELCRLFIASALLIFTGIHSHLNDMFIGTSSAVKESYCGHGLNAFNHYILQAAVKCQTGAELGLNSLSVKSPSRVTKTDWLKSLQATSLIY